MNTIVKRFGFSLGAVALLCTVGWAATSAHAASQTSLAEQDAPPCSSTQVMVVQQSGATTCVNMDQTVSFPHTDKVKSITNNTGVLAVFYSSDGSNVVVIEPKQTKSNLPRPKVDTNVKVLSSPSCPPGQVTVIQRNQDNPVCLNRGDSANVVEVLAIRNRTVAYTIFNGSRIYPGETRTFTGFPSGTVMVEQ